MQRVQHGKGATPGEGVRGGTTTQVPRFSPKGDSPHRVHAPLGHPTFLMDSPYYFALRDL